jgi:hypothetical protein
MRRRRVAKERHTAAFVVGMMIGGAAGAAVTFWKTPMSGAQVRARIAETAESVKQQVLAFGERLGIELGEPEPKPAAVPVVTISETEPIPPPIPPINAEEPLVPFPIPTPPDRTPSAPAPQPGFASSPLRTSPEPSSSSAATGPPLTPNS